MGLWYRPLERFRPIMTVTHPFYVHVGEALIDPKVLHLEVLPMDVSRAIWLHGTVLSVFLRLLIKVTNFVLFP